MAGAISTAVTLNDLFNKMTSDKGQIEFKGRTIQWEVKGRIHKLKLVYDCRAWDVESGTSVHAKHYQSKQGAKEHGVRDLVDQLKAKGLIEA
ncbi:anti-lipopolysaccharide factor-like isoform X2 [Glandiceps talaboti]